MLFKKHPVKSVNLNIRAIIELSLRQSSLYSLPGNRGGWAGFEGSFSKVSCLGEDCCFSLFVSRPTNTKLLSLTIFRL
jgi:hypothetical protein